MKKKEKINELAAALGPILGTQIVNPWRLDLTGIAAALVEEGFGNLREFKAEIISLYLKGDITGLLKVLQEEI